MAICVDANFWLFSRSEKSTHGQLLVWVGGWEFPMKGIVPKVRVQVSHAWLSLFPYMSLVQCIAWHVHILPQGGIDR